MARIETDPNYSTPTFSRATAATDLFKKEDVQNLAAAVSTHDHATGRGMPVGTIAAGAVTTASIANGAVTTLKLAVDAVTQVGQAVGQASSPTTTSTTASDMPDMSVTLTTTGGDLLLWFSGTFTESVGGQYATFSFKIDATADLAIALWQPSGTGWQPFSAQYWMTGLAAGSHTVKMRWQTSAGTLTATQTFRVLTVMERTR